VADRIPFVSSCLGTAGTSREAYVGEAFHLRRAAPTAPLKTPMASARRGVARTLKALEGSAKWRGRRTSPATKTPEKPISAATKIGSSSTLKEGYRTPTATGISTQLTDEFPKQVLTNVMDHRPRQQLASSLLPRCSRTTVISARNISVHETRTISLPIGDRRAGRPVLPRHEGRSTAIAAWSLSADSECSTQKSDRRLHQLGSLWEGGLKPHPTFLRPGPPPLLAPHQERDQ